MQQDYCGEDKLDLTLPLIEALQIKLTISSSADLEELMKLSPTAISNLCQPKAIQQQLIDQFEKLETLVVWIHELSPAKLRAIFPLIGAGLAKNFFMMPVI
ncbi:hypothetical protein [Legionella tunisiensis]|uniref:hypothetical protein n=1 Tax=Legionella tunisiensis TaxID=1034944 RepID=UPI0002F7B0D7|nr:hypothetical protein [Legionella tunisiensis]